VWINGHHVAYHEGGFTPFEVDISDLVISGPNVLALRVKEHTTVSDKLDHMSLYADFPLGGIIRTPYLFRVSSVHVEEIVHAVHFAKGNRSAVLNGTIKIANESAHSVPGFPLQVTLKTLAGKLVASSSPSIRKLGAWQEAVCDFRIKVDSPKPWTAETPDLYLLQVSPATANAPMVEYTEKTGLRETNVDGTQIRIDGSPVKFRGTCHHDSHPLMGRAVTPALTKLDLHLIKAANLNSLRTSHYPPIPELIDLADEMGVYVEDEADFCWAEGTNDLRNTPRIIQLTAELLARDRNHPSVFEWSICNESQFGYGFERSHEWVRNADPSRPNSAATSSWLEIATLHNPISIEGIHRNANIAMPLLWDESLCIYQGIFNDVAEMWVDPGMRDYYVKPLIDVYRAFMDSKTVQGSMIWCWADDIFCVPGRGYEYGRGTAQSHFIDHEYRMPGRGLVGDAPWGVVDGWRRLKPEFWLTKKLHSPIKLSEARIASIRADGSVRVPVENQYDFLNLSQIKATFEIDKLKGVLKLQVPPRSRGEIVVSGLNGRSTGKSLRLRFEASDGRLIDEYRIPIGRMIPGKVKLSPTTPLKLNKETWLAGDSTRVTGRGFELSFDRDQGYLRRCVAGTQPLLLAFPALHVLPTSTPLSPVPEAVRWNCTGVKVAREGGNVRVEMTGTYPQFEGSYSLLVHPDGTVVAHYSFKYTGDDMRAREIGWGLDLARECETFEWDRQAEWNVYPSDHIGRPHGIATAMVEAKTAVGTGSWSADPSPMGSNDFRSTKRNIHWIDIRVGNGPGICVPSDGNHSARAMVQPDRTSVFIDDWFGGTNVGWGEWITNYGKGKEIKKGEVLESNLTLRIHS